MNEDSLVEKLRVVIHDEIQKETRSVVQEEIQKNTRAIVQEEIHPLVQSVTELKNRVTGLEKNYDSLNQAVARMEVDFGDSLRFLCDYAKASIEKHEELERQLKIHSDKLDNHSMRIANLEDFQKQFVNQK